MPKKTSQNVKHFECARPGCTTVVVQGQTGSLQPYHNHWTNLGPRLCSKCYRHYVAEEPEKAKHNKRNKKGCDKEADALEALENTIVGDGSELADPSPTELDAVYDCMCKETRQPTTSTPSLGKITSFEPEENLDFEEDCNEKEEALRTLNYAFHVRQKKCQKNEAENEQ